jgi:hypothetical protein
MAGRALCVGINKFRDRDIRPLRGCVNDARDIAEILVEQYGFDANCVRLLLDEQATKANYLTHLDWLITGARAGDTVVLFTSSHGSHIPDQNGDEADDEDEVLVMYDHDWSRTVLTDDEIEAHLRRLPQGATLITLWDTCHSGTLNDGAYASNNRAVSAPGRVTGRDLGPNVTDIQGKYIVPPPHLLPKRRAQKSAPVSLGGIPITGWSAPDSRATSAASRERPSGMFKPDLRALTFAACKDDETAADASFGGRYSGAFTYALRQMLERADGDIAWSDLFTQTRQTLKRQDFDQTPELYGLDALKRSPAFGGGRSRTSRAPGAHAAPTDRGVRGVPVAALDQQIGQLEAAGNWAGAAQALQQRVAAVDSVEEKVRTLEHMVGLYRVKLQDERGAVRVAEQLIALSPRHEGAASYLRAVYTQAGDRAKLQQLDAHVAKGAQAQPGGGGGIYSSVTSAVGSAVTAVGAAATGIANAVAEAPVAYEMPDAPKKPRAQAPATPRCAYCGADMNAGVRQCPQCGAES